MNKLWGWVAPNRENYSFFLTFICILGLFSLAFIKGSDILGTLVAVQAAYLASKTGEKVSAHLAASRDPKADTRAIINDLEGTSSPDNPDAN